MKKQQSVVIGGLIGELANSVERYYNEGANYHAYAKKASELLDQLQKLTEDLSVHSVDLHENVREYLENVENIVYNLPQRPYGLKFNFGD